MGRNGQVNYFVMSILSQTNQEGTFFVSLKRCREFRAELTKTR